MIVTDGRLSCNQNVALLFTTRTRHSTQQFNFRDCRPARNSDADRRVRRNVQRTDAATRIQRFRRAWDRF